MTLPVFWVDDVADAVRGSLITLEGPEGRHAVVVRRLRAGESLVLGDGRGTSAEAEIVETTKHSLVARVVSVRTRPAPTPSITVVQAIPKGDRGELAVEMLTEVDVDRIVPWTAARCVAVWRGDRVAKGLAKWRATAREAAKQARRDHLPEVTAPAGTAAVAELMVAADVAVVLHESATEALVDLPVGEATSMVVVVGPEGGIAPEELEEFASAGAHVVRLGESVLRTSTSGVVAAGALLSRTPRWAAPTPG